jgi:hypothetical protein
VIVEITASAGGDNVATKTQAEDVMCVLRYACERLRS